MIVEWAVQQAMALAGWMVGVVPGPGPGVNPAAGITSILGPVMDGVGNLGGWIPWDVVNVIVPISIALYLSGFVLRIAKSFLPTMSG